MDEPTSLWSWLTHPSFLYSPDSLSASFVTLSSLHLCICFVLLGICSSDYLCPNVANITNNRDGSKAHKRVLAAILLSWCNSSPDLFSNFMSWTSSNAAALSVGEVLGSCGVILCVVQGAIFITMASITLDISGKQRHDIVGDLLFIVVATLMVLYVCVRNHVSMLNCLTMLSVYAVYIFIKIFPEGSTDPESNATAQQAQSSVRYSPSVGQSTPGLPNTLWNYADSPDDVTLLGIPETKSGIKPSLLTVMDYNNLLAMLEGSLTLENDEEAISLKTLSTNSHLKDIVKRPSTEPSSGTINEEYTDNPPAQTAPPAFRPYHDNPDSVALDVVPKPIRYKSLLRRRMSRLKSGALFLFMPHLVSFRDESWIKKTISVLMTPFIVLLRLSCPQHDEILRYDDLTSNLSMDRVFFYLLLIQSLISPFFTFLIISALVGFPLRYFYFFIPGCMSMVLSTMVVSLHKKVKDLNSFSLTSDSRNEDAKEDIMNFTKIVSKVFILIGIVNSILWISLLANTLIEIIELYQKTLDISQAILGLTIFSWGNSISDLMANVAMCKLYQNFPVSSEEHMSQLASKFFAISLGACSGGILLNSMIGIGLSGLVAMIFFNADQSSGWWIFRSVELHENGVDIKFIVSSVAVLIQALVLILVFSGISNTFTFFQQNLRKVGILMCFWWALASLLNVLLELVSGVK